MKSEWMPIAMLPNVVGFQFIALLASGAQVHTVVTVRENGIHTFSEFKNAVGWKQLPTTNKKSKQQ